MNVFKLRLITVTLAASALAACGGGGSSTPAGTVSQNAATAAPASAGNSGITSGTRLTFTINRKSLGTGFTPASMFRKVTGRAKPQYLSNAMNGLQVSVTDNTGALPTHFYDVSTDINNNLQCAQTTVNGAFACTVVIPVLSTSETLKVLELDQGPTGTIDPNTGFGGNFPSSAAVLASGTVTVTPVPGAITNVALSMNPVISQFFDCGFNPASNTPIRDDFNNNAPRLVMTGNAPSGGFLYPVAADFDFNAPSLVAPPNGSALQSQPYVDVDSAITPVPLTLTTSASSHVVMYPLQFGLSTNLPIVFTLPGPFASTVSIPDTSYQNFELAIGLKYDGLGTPSAAGTTLTIKNNLTKTAPAFAGAPVGRCCGELNPGTTYAMQFSWTIAPVFVTPAATTVAVNGTTSLTGYDPASPNDMLENDCYDAYGNDLGFAAPNGPLAGGMQAWTFHAGGTPGVCTFTLQDNNTGIRSNPVSVTIQ